MPMTFQVLMNRFPEIAVALPVLMDGVADHAATVLHDTAVDLCPVDTGAMQASILKEKTDEDHYEVSVQKNEALSGSKTYALFVDSGTVHMAAQPFFHDACQAAADDLNAATLPGLL
jgi:HK97 gp10 family phage protein